MAFQLSDAVNKDRVFVVKRSELEGRLDCDYYRPEIVARIRKIESLKHIRLGNKIQALGTGKNNIQNAEHGTAFIRTQNIRPIKLDLNTTSFTNDKVIRLSQKGDLLFTRIGVGVGDVSYNDVGQFAISDNVIFARFEDEIFANYCSIFLSTPLGSVFIEREKRDTARAIISYGNIKKILIPEISRKLQSKIINHIEAAYAAKKQKEAQAQLLLDSIDTYLLNELGIELPVEEENTIRQRMFVRKFSEVSGGRFDAPGNWNRLSLASTIFDNVAFVSQVEINPLTDHSFLDDTAEATFVPMEAVSEIYAEADLNQKRVLAESKGYTVFQDGDLIWAKITPCMENGKSAVVHELLNGVGFGSTEFHVFRGKGGVDINYIHALLRLKCLRRNAVNFFSGSAGHQRVDELFFRKLTIPLPPPEKQQEIAAHIQTLRDQAKQLRAEAAANLEQAKQEVEAMIIGKETAA